MRLEKAAEILGCSLGSPEEEIRKKYRAAAMKMHPDRPGGSQEDFMQLNKAYQLLLHRNKKDTNGPITKWAYDQFKQEYEGSQEEREEIFGLYRKHRGCMAKIVDHMLLGEDEQEERYREILDAEIGKGSLPEYPGYKKGKGKRLLENKKRQAKREKEAAKAQELLTDLESRAQDRQARWDSMVARLEQQVGEKKQNRRNK